MAKRKTIGEVGEERVTRRSTRAKTATEEEEPVREEKRVEATKVTEATKAKAKASPTKDEETEGDKKEGKVCVIFSSCHFFCFYHSLPFHAII